MKPAATWTIGGDFLIVDTDNENAPLAELKLYEPLRSMAIENPIGVVEELIRAIEKTPHPYAEENKDE